MDLPRPSTSDAQGPGEQQTEPVLVLEPVPVPEYYDDDEMEPLKIEVKLRPPKRISEPFTRTPKTFGWSKSKRSSNSPKKSRVEEVSSTEPSSPDIDPDEVQGCVVIRTDVINPPDTIVAEMLKYDEENYTTVFFAIVWKIRAFSDGYLSENEMNNCWERLKRSRAMQDSCFGNFTGLERVRYVVCQVCGTPRYVCREEEGQAWIPQIESPCPHTEPYRFGAHFQHPWWSHASQCGLAVINPGSYPFNVLFDRLGDLANIVTAALVVSGVFPIWNRTDPPSQWPMGREFYVETNEQLERTAAWGFMRWVRDHEEVEPADLWTLSPPRLCQLCGTCGDDPGIHHGVPQPAVCRSIFDVERGGDMGIRITELILHHRPIMWLGRPSVKAFLDVVKRATFVQTEAVRCLLSLIGAVVLTADQTNPSLLEGPKIKKDNCKDL